jgi:hypothetical protein
MARFAAPHMRVTVTHKLAAMMPNFIMPLITRSSRSHAHLGPKAAWGKARKVALAEPLLSVAKMGHMNVHVWALAVGPLCGREDPYSVTHGEIQAS